MTIQRIRAVVLRSANRVMDIGLCLVRKWWRPLVCVGMGGALIVNGIVIPLLTRISADLTGLAALCAALTPFAWLRTVEKREGVASRDTPMP